MTPGIYPDISLDAYIADPAPEPSLNASTAHALLTQSPFHAWLQHPKLNPDHEREDNSRAELGTIAHALLMEGDNSKVVIVQADDWRTKAAKEKRDEARAASKLPILEKHYETVQQMVLSCECALAESEVADDWAGAASEQTLLWQEGNIWFRSRPDKLTTDCRVAFDYKTTGSAHPSDFLRTLINSGYDLQAVLGLRGLKALRPEVEEATFVFVVQEIEPPFAVSLISLAPEFLSVARARLQLAIDVWTRCRTKNDWPGYPRRIAYLDPPGYYGMDHPLVDLGD